MDEKLHLGDSLVCFGYPLGKITALREETEGVYYVIAAITLDADSKDGSEYVDVYSVYRITDVNGTVARAHAILKKETEDYDTALRAYLQGDCYNA